MIAPLTMIELLGAYREHRCTPVEYLTDVLERIDRHPARHVWTARLPHEQILDLARLLADRSPEDLPLYGVPFAIKDNIDLAGVATTAACPAFAYTPSESAWVVQKLMAAGAIPVGKTNLDQFATGLVGTRSPYGACENAFDSDYISGGSSSGSALAVAHGFASFALGTDTAGSGRVPAAFNNLVGLKPSLGRLSTRGVVPACRSLDCVSILALSAADARRVLQVAEGFDPQEAYSRDYSGSRAMFAGGMRIGVPRVEQREFYGDRQYESLFAAAIDAAMTLDAQIVTVDIEPFLAAAKLLYEGPWVAERYAAVGAFIERHRDAVDSTVGGIIAGGAAPTAVQAFEAQYRLQSLKAATQAIWRDIDCLLLPTAPTIHKRADVQREPVRLNSQLGLYTNFVNLLDLAALAVPAGFRADGLPFGVTLIASAGADNELLEVGARLHSRRVERCGALEVAVPAPEVVNDIARGFIPLIVCGAHMRDLPLNPQLTQRGAYFVAATKTSDRYRFYALAGGPPYRPGLVRTHERGAAIDVEVWALPSEYVGSFIEGIPAPLGIGKIELADGRWLPGFICEGAAVAGARDITALGGWRQYLAGSA